jgi:hypothetical protein
LHIFAIFKITFLSISTLVLHKYSILTSLNVRTLKFNFFPVYYYYQIKSFVLILLLHIFVVPYYMYHWLLLTEFFNYNHMIKAVAKSASRSLGLVIASCKVNGGFEYSTFSKLFDKSFVLHHKLKMSNISLYHFHIKILHHQHIKVYNFFLHWH